jgi:subtilisin family serine protease
MNKKKISSMFFITIILISIISTPIITNIQGEPEYVEVLLELNEGTNCDELKGFEVLDQVESANLYRIKVSRSNYNKLKRLACVRQITEYQNNIKLEMFQDILPQGVRDIDAEVVWGGSQDAYDVAPGRPSGEGVKVAIIDGGIQTDHPDLIQNYVGGWDYVEGDNDPMETRDEYPYNHGTKCAGIIAMADNDLDYSGIGVAPNIELYALKIDTVNGLAGMLQLISALSWCKIYDMDVVSISIGIDIYFPNPTMWALVLLVDNALSDLYINNIAVVASSGNYPQMPHEDNVYYPASSGWTLAVGAYDPYQRENERIEISEGYSFSSCYGTQLSVLAPGWGCYTTKPGGGYDPGFGGTSAAAPHVAGIAALMRAANPSISVNDIYGIISSTAEDIGPAGKDLENGYGIVNAYDAVMLAEAIPPTVDIFRPSYNYQPVSGSYQIKATASDDFGILASVEVSINNEPWQACTPISNYWAWTWDTIPYPEGNHRIRCRATDLAGNTDIDQVYAKVDNIPDGGGGGGCPILSVFDGEEYQDEGLLDIHDSEGNDVTYQHTLINSPIAIDNRYHLKLTEHPKTISDIDQVGVYGILPSNRRIRLPLVSAIHCEDGQVRYLLRKSDDKKAEVLGADYNNGVSQYIDLEFFSPQELHFTNFVFVIEGNNAFEK